MNSSTIPPQPASPQPPCLTVRLLGDFVLHEGDEPITLVNTPRLQALLTDPLLHWQASQSRRHLAFLFWPDSTEAQALTNLRKQLLYLRPVLPVCDRLLAMDRQGVHWLPGAAIALDVERFQAALAAAAQLTDKGTGMGQALARPSLSLDELSANDFCSKLSKKLDSMIVTYSSAIQPLLKSNRINYARGSTALYRMSTRTPSICGPGRKPLARLCSAVAAGFCARRRGMALCQNDL